MRIILVFVLNAGINLGLGLAMAALLGPADYGRFAVGTTVSVVLAMASFDWLRLATTRFYGERRRSEDPGLRGTLDGAYLALSALLGLAVAAATLAGLDFGLGPALLAAAVLTALGNGWFDFYAALARARFLDRAYLALTMTKNVLAIGFGVAAAVLLEDAAATLAGTALGALLSLLAVVRTLHDPAARLRLGTVAVLRGCAVYGMPIVVANVVFQLVALMNRSTAAAAFGFAEAGRLSLATDLGLRAFIGVGSAVDVFLFQLAVRREAEAGPAAAEAQLGRNAVIVLAVLALGGVGYAMALPAFEAVLVPQRYRGDFGILSLLLLPGLVLFCVGQFALGPVFQIAGRTGPIVVAALASLAADALGLALVPREAGIMGIAAVHSASLAVGALVILVLAARASAAIRWTADYPRIALAAGVTALTLWPVRAIEPAWLSLALAAGLGTLVYGACLFALDVAGLRGLAAAQLGRFGLGRPTQRA